MKPKDNVTYQHIIDAAEKLFSDHGYASVRLEDIAKAVGMRHASLYYYAPRGKEQLYIDIMERIFRQHSAGLTRVIIEAGDDLRTQVHAIAEWFATQPPVDLGRMVRSDITKINPADAERLLTMSLESLRVPIAAAIRHARKKGLLDVEDADFAAMGLVALLQSVHNIPSEYRGSQENFIKIARSTADMLLFGWFKR